MPFRSVHTAVHGHWILLRQINFTEKCFRCATASWSWLLKCVRYKYIIWTLVQLSQKRTTDLFHEPMCDDKGVGYQTYLRFKFSKNSKPWKTESMNVPVILWHVLQVQWKGIFVTSLYLYESFSKLWAWTPFWSVHTPFHWNRVLTNFIYFTNIEDFLVNYFNGKDRDSSWKWRECFMDL